MHITRHAQTRSQQRCVRADAIAFALDHGETNPSRDGATVHCITDRVLAQHGLPSDSHLRGVAVVTVGATLVTVWKNSKSHRQGVGRKLRETTRRREAEAEVRHWRGPIPRAGFDTIVDDPFEAPENYAA